MKYTYDDYLKRNEKYDLHKGVSDIINSLPKNINNLKNIILYGPCNVGKYTQALKIASMYSPSKLKYEKKIIIENPSKKDTVFNIKISDIHFDIDLDILGYHSKTLWNDIYLQIIEIVKSRKINKGIIICKNFHNINYELLEIFYNYMQDEHLVFILLTENISFLSDNILNISHRIDIKQPSNNQYKEYTKTLNITNDTSNSNDIIYKNIILTSKVNKLILDKRKDELIKTITNNVLNYETINFTVLRDNIYDIFIYNINMYDFMLDIIRNVYNKIPEDKVKILNNILIELFYCLKYYNNNYRPIYHIEKYLLYLSKTINEF